MLKISIYLSSLVAASWLLGAPVVAEVQDSPQMTLLIDYDSRGPFSLGDGVDIANLDDGPRLNCIDYDNSPRVEDAENGTSVIHVSISVIKDLDDLETKLGRSLSLEAGLSGSYLQFAEGSVQTSLSRTYSQFLREARSSLMISVRVVADHGRTWLNYNLREEAERLISEELFEDFRQLCGSHFIRAARRESALEYDIVVTGLSRETKEMLAGKASASFEAGAGTSGISTSARGSMRDSMKSFVRTAKHFGQMSVNVRLVGAPGIDIVAPALTNINIADAESIDKLFSSWSKVLKGFRGSKGVTRDFILQRYAQLPEVDQTYHKFVFLGKVIKRLMLVEQLLQDYASYEEEQKDLWGIYFKDKTENLQGLRDRLSSEYTKCSSLDECSLESLPSNVDDFSIEDVLYNGTLKAVCGWGFEANIAGTSTAVLSDIAVSWHGWMNFPNFVDRDATKAFRIDEAGTRHDIQPFNYGYDISVEPNVLRFETDSNRHGPGRAIIQFVNLSLGEGDVFAGNGINQRFLDQQKTALARSQFGVEFRFPSGRTVAQTLGYPDFRECLKLRKLRDLQ